MCTDEEIKKQHERLLWMQDHFLIEVRKMVEAIQKQEVKLNKLMMEEKNE